MNMPRVPEEFVRDVWEHRKFSADNLRSADGKRIHILSPGVPNTDAGPDFTNARIRIGNTLFLGDVEIHCDASGWTLHGHDRDPHYNRVILHVVMTYGDEKHSTSTASRRTVPVLVLHPFLDLKTYVAWIQSPRRSPATLRCAAHNDGIPAHLIAQKLELLAEERIEFKVRRFGERLKALIDEERAVIREPFPRYYGNPDEIPPPSSFYSPKDFRPRRHWEQLLYEGIMEGLGYAKNQEPFLRLAQSARLATLRRFDLSDKERMMALLFGAAGLLPSATSIKEKESRIKVRGLRKLWKALRPSFTGQILHQGDWRFFRLRPANFPTARIAGFCHLLPVLFAETGFRNLISLAKVNDLSASERNRHIQSLFDYRPDEFWNYHYHFDNRTERPTGGLGASRINDLMVNVIIPVLLLYARVFRDSLLRMQAREMLSSLPATENSIGKIIEEQLVKKKLSIGSALMNQGVLQLYKYHCLPEHCRDCEIGKVCLPENVLAIARNHS